jgi:hypothetical protein
MRFEAMPDVDLFFSGLRPALPKLLSIKRTARQRDPRPGADDRYIAYNFDFFAA